MKLTPMGIWLSMANRAGAYWAAAGAAFLRQQQNVAQTEITREAKKVPSRKRKRRKRR